LADERAAKNNCSGTCPGIRVFADGRITMKHLVLSIAEKITNGISCIVIVVFSVA
jgi:hypothetical protein